MPDTTVSELRDRVEAARTEYQHALDAQYEAIKFRVGIPDPDGTQLLYHVNQTLKAAFERYTEALKNLSDYVLRRTVPSTVQLLLVEDNYGDVLLFEELVAHGPMLVKLAVAQNCARAVATLSNGFKPNLVIADMGVLEFGGMELMKQCNPRGIPVVGFSGSLNPKDRENVLRLGAKEFVEKPTTLDEYADVLRKMIGKWATPEA